MKLKQFLVKYRKIFLVIGLGLLIMFIIMCSVKSCVNAEEGFYIDYGDYNYVGYVSYTEEVSGGLAVDIESVGAIQLNELVADTSLAYTYFLQNGDPREFETGDTLYLFELDTQGQLILSYTLYSDYISNQLVNYYNSGYGSGSVDSGSSSYTEGYNQGRRETWTWAEQYIDEAIWNEQQYYNEILARQDATILELQHALEDANRGFKFATFADLLGTIVVLPVRFFKEGLNVNVFGINVGGFIVAIVMVSITLGILGIVLVRKK